MNLYESGENYLETILILHNKTGFVRSIDVATELGFSKPSISRAMGILKQNQLIIIKDNGQILLTDKGKERAELIYNRHTFINKYLRKIGVSEETAEQDACRIEHVISDETFQKLKDYISKEQ